MFVSDAGEEHLFEVLPVIFLVFAYPDDAILDDVGHNYFFLFIFMHLFSPHQSSNKFGFGCLA